MPATPKLRKVEIRNKTGCQATYEVLVDGAVVGHVDKYVYREVTHAGHRGGSATREASFTIWGQRRPGTLEEPPGCNRRREAVDRLMGLYYEEQMADGRQTLRNPHEES